MIAAAEIHRHAREWGIDPMIVELDYVLGCFLSRWFRHPMAAKMIFKGGTCLRKCYFPDYRFSEYIDITAQEPVDAGPFREAIEVVASDLAQTAGVDLRAQPPRIETADAGDGTPYIEARLYVRGPLRRTGWPQAIRIDISTGEPMAFPAVKRELDHPYSDSAAIGAEGLRIPCYDLREMLLEKLRGLSGQHRYAIARDLYDAHRLLDHAQIAIGDVIPYARAKFAARGLGISPGLVASIEARKDEFMNDWGRNVDRLIPGERRGGGSMRLGRPLSRPLRPWLSPGRVNPKSELPPVYVFQTKWLPLSHLICREAHHHFRRGVVRHPFSCPPPPACAAIL